jgi:hypothetical protein
LKGARRCCCAAPSSRLGQKRDGAIRVVSHDWRAALVCAGPVPRAARPRRCPLCRRGGLATEGSNENFEIEELWTQADLAEHQQALLLRALELLRTAPRRFDARAAESLIEWRAETQPLVLPTGRSDLLAINVR